jgi:hypothetical protein
MILVAYRHGLRASEVGLAAFELRRIFLQRTK